MTKKSYVIENGLTVGVVGLAAVTVLAVGLPRWAHEPSHAAPKLPDSLSGGYVHVANAQTDQIIAKQTVDLSSAIGQGVASQFYINQSAQAFAFVQAVRADGTAILPVLAGTVSKVGADVCIQTQLQNGSAASTCRRSDSDLTVQVTSPVDTGTAAKYVDEVWKKLS